MQQRFGLIGARHPHVEYLRSALANNPQVRLVALVEDDQSLREQFAARLGVPAYADYRRLLAQEQLDAAGVVTVNGTRRHDRRRVPGGRAARRLRQADLHNLAGFDAH